MAFTEEAIRAKLEEAFNAADADGDGAISPDDLAAVFENAGMKVTDDQVAEIIAVADADGTGSLSFEQFATAIIGLGVVVIVVAILKKVFDAIDADGSGFISPDDVRTVIDDAGYGDKVSDDQIAEAVAACDADGDGKISFEDFARGVAAAIEASG